MRVVGVEVANYQPGLGQLVGPVVEFTTSCGTIWIIEEEDVKPSRLVRDPDG